MAGKESWKVVRTLWRKIPHSPDGPGLSVLGREWMPQKNVSVREVGSWTIYYLYIAQLAHLSDISPMFPELRRGDF